jgi:hypothetical protein
MALPVCVATELTAAAVGKEDAAAAATEAEAMLPSSASVATSRHVHAVCFRGVVHSFILAWTAVEEKMHGEGRQDGGASLRAQARGREGAMLSTHCAAVVRSSFKFSSMYVPVPAPVACCCCGCLFVYFFDR